MPPNSKKTPPAKKLLSKTAAVSDSPPSPDPPTTYWSLRLQGADIENRIDLEFASLIAGATIITADTAIVYATSHASAVTCFRHAQAAGLLASEPQFVPPENWHAQCAELWDPLTVVDITVQPVMSASDRSSAPPTTPTLYLIPGTGFGTGHHATTRMILQLMQRPGPRSRPPHRTLDLGTGSGILAIAAAMLFGGQIDAIDTDPMAIDNARENASLNSFSGAIHWCVGTVENARPPYHLVCANLYASLLESLAPAIIATLAPGATLLLSGIRQGEVGDVQEVYNRHQLALRESLEADGWCGLMYERNRVE